MVKRKFGELRIDYSGFTCPIQKAVTIIGDKWTLFIIREFIYGNEKQGFNDLLRALKPISSRTLSLKLKKLEECGIIKRKIINARPVKVEYSLTQRGKALRTPLQKMGEWFKEEEKAPRKNYYTNSFI